MLILSDSQISAMAQPGIERLVTDTLTDLKQQYPEAVAGYVEDELLEKLRMLLAETDWIPVHEADNINAYMITCVRHQVSYMSLCQNPKIQAVLVDSSWHETEKVYLISHLLTRS